MKIIKKLTQVNVEPVKEMALSTGEKVTPADGEGFLEVIIIDPPKVQCEFFHGDNLKWYIPKHHDPQVFFGPGHGHFGVAFDLRKQSPAEAVKAFKTFAEKYWLNQEVDA